MSIDLIALSSSSGLPLATRRSNIRGSNSRRDDDDDDDGNLSNGIALNTITTLYSLNLFARLNECDLQLAKTSDGQSKIQWKLFNESIVLVVVTNDVDFLAEADLDTLLELTFDAIVMMCGLTAISDSNTERLKRNIKIAYPLIDYFLNSFSSNDKRRLELITRCSDYAIASRSSYISSLVNNIAQAASSNYCALFVHRRLLSASHDWWSRLNSSRDSFLISCLLNSLLDIDLIQTKEILIHLPCVSPTSLTRLVISQITKGVVLCILCAEYPTLEYIESEILVPLSDLKLQEEKFSKYIYELRETKYLSQSTLSEILGKHASILANISAFVIVSFEQQLCFEINEDLIKQYLEEIVTFCEFGSEKSSSSNCAFSDAYLTCGQISMYRTKCKNKNLLLCALFASNQSVKQMSLLSVTLVEAFSKAKHFWP